MANTYERLDKAGLAILWEKIKNKLSGKVDKVDGKGLSSNDFTADEKAKLANIAAGAEVNVNADWKATTGDAAILNKPSIPSKTSDLDNDSDFVSDASYVHTDANFTTTEKTKLSGIAEGANKITVDTAMSASSTNPVQNKIINTALSGKVDKETGKGLSTNDYTTTEKDKLAGIAEGANKTTVDTAMSDSSSNPVQNKTVKSYIDNAIGGITGIDFKVVTTLPTTGVKGTIYLVSNGGSGQNAYDEYIYVGSSWEKIGTTAVDLSGYVKFTDIPAITEAEINTICV